MDIGLKGKLARVTRSSSGLGKTTALTLLQEAERVVGHRLTWTRGEAAYFDGLAIQKDEPYEIAIHNYFQNDEPTSLIQRFVLPKEVARTIIKMAANKAANGGSYHIEGGIVRNIL